LKAAINKKQITFKGKSIKITVAFSTEILKAKEHGVRHFGY
jgi:hypothetical protein